MEDLDYPVMFIVVPPTEEYLTVEQNAPSLDNVINNISPYLKGREILLASFISNASLNLAKYIHSRMMVFNQNRELFSKFTFFGEVPYEKVGEECKSHPFINHVNISYCHIPTVRDEAFLEAFQTSTENKGSTLLIIENYYAEKLKQLSVVRNEEEFTYGFINRSGEQYNLENEGGHDPQDIYTGDDEEICEQLQKFLRKNPLSQLFEDKLRVIDETCTELSSFQSHLEVIEEAVKSLNNSSNSAGKISESSLNNFENKVNKAEELLKDCTTIIDYALDIKNTFSDPKNEKTPGSFLQVKKFYYNQDLEAFKLQIENSTDSDYYNVSVFVLETEEKLCDFSLIEKKTKVWKETELGYKDDIYGFHLIVVSQDQIVLKDPYFISKCKLKVIEKGEEVVDEEYYPKRAAMAYTVEVKNYSMEPMVQLLLNIPESVVGLKFTSDFLDYSEVPQKDFISTQFNPDDQLKYGKNYMLTFKANYNFDDNFKSLSENYKIFVCSGNAIVSNTILLSDVKNLDV